jgi:hypothetical protein
LGFVWNLGFGTWKFCCVAAVLRGNFTRTSPTTFLLNQEFKQLNIGEKVVGDKSGYESFINRTSLERATKEGDSPVCENKIFVRNCSQVGQDRRNPV